MWLRRYNYKNYNHSNTERGFFNFEFLLFKAALQSESKFARAYAAGVPKSEYWLSTFEDSLDLIAKLPVIAAMIYRNVYKDGAIGVVDPKKVSYCLQCSLHSFSLSLSFCFFPSFSLSLYPSLNIPLLPILLY